MSSSSEAVTDVVEIAPLTAGRGGGDSWVRRVRVQFGQQAFEVKVRGSPLMSDDHAIETARAAVVEQVGVDDHFRHGVVLGDAGRRRGGGERTYSRDDILRAIRQVAREIGHAPTRNEYKQHRPPESPASSAIYLRFDGWVAAREVALGQ